MQSPPFLSSRIAAAAALRMLTCASPNHNPRFLRTSMSTASSDKTLISHPPLFSNPSTNPSSNHLETPKSSSFKALNPSLPISIPTASETDGDPCPHQSLVVVSFYKFADFPDHAGMRKPLKDLCEEVVALFSHRKESMEAYVGLEIRWKGFWNLFNLINA